tara:strand:+ start:25847 stop:26515 length:669 start_codon:yes stop_codon:yes gene_type:complete
MSGPIYFFQNRGDSGRTREVEVIVGRISSGNQYDFPVDTFWENQVSGVMILPEQLQNINGQIIKIEFYNENPNVQPYTWRDINMILMETDSTQFLPTNTQTNNFESQLSNVTNVKTVFGDNPQQTGNVNLSYNPTIGFYDPVMGAGLGFFEYTGTKTLVIKLTSRQGSFYQSPGSTCPNHIHEVKNTRLAYHDKSVAQLQPGDRGNSFFEQAITRITFRINE